MTIVSPNLTVSFQYIPEFVNSRMYRRFIYLMWWNRAVDHIAIFARYQETNIRPRWRNGVRFIWKHYCFHLSS